MSTDYSEKLRTAIRTTRNGIIARQGDADANRNTALSALDVARKNFASRSRFRRPWRNT